MEDAASTLGVQMRGKYCTRSQKLGRENEEWIHLAQINYKWQAIDNTAMNPHVPLNVGNLLIVWWVV